MFPHRKLLLVSLVACAFAGTACGESIVTVPPSACVWHAGDNPAWAAPTLDESAWKPLSAWAIKGNQPWMWVRCHADLSALRQATHPALQVYAWTAYQLFLNGSQVGHFGKLENGQSSVDPAEVFPLAAGNVTSGAGTVALRMKYRVLESPEGKPPVVLAGEAGWLRDRSDSEFLAGAKTYLPVVVGFGVIGVMGFVLLGLYLNDRSHLELLLLALVCWCLALLRVCDFCTAAMVPIPDWMMWTAYAVGQAMVVPLPWFMFRLARRRVPLFYKILIAVALVFVVNCLSNAIFPARVSLWADAVYSGKGGWVLLVVGGILMTSPFAAFWPWKKIPRGMRPLAACAMLWALMDVTWFAAETWQAASSVGDAFFVRWRPELLELRVIGTISAVIALIGLLFREHRRTVQERAVLAGEMQAAREIQRMLAPESVETAAGVRVDVAFRPMREVGGDFYLCRALPDGRQRVLVGDVSGKGAAAAMTATLLVGAAERREGDSPKALLQHLNLVLHASQVGGFATCLCADLAPDGTVTVANAGHLAPYCRGEEVAVLPSLPLGVSTSDAPYEERRVALAEGETLTFLSDGVVEARDAEGRLFGFERTRAISEDAAEKIAETAQDFGQQDDITVVKLTRKVGRAAAVLVAGAVPEAV